MYLSYSGFKTFRSCQRSYYYRYLGNVVVDKPPNSVHMLYGDAIGKLFEKFFNCQMWKSSVPELELTNSIRSVVNQVLIQETRKGNVFDWTVPGLKPGCRSVEDVEEAIRKTVSQGVQIIKHHHLVGDVTTEVVLDVDRKGHRIGGRADFIIRRHSPFDDLLIVDGKGTRYRDKYVDVRQLRWYAMLYRLREKILPDLLGFLYWRCEPEASMDWYKPVVAELDDLLRAVFETIHEIELSVQKIDGGADPNAVFWATPNSNCTRCNYSSLCSEGAKNLSDNVKAQILQDRNNGVEEGDVSF